MSRIPNVTLHAIDRAAVRLGRALTRAEWNSIVLSIVERRAVLLLNQRRDDTREVWLAACGSIALKVVWAPDTATVITILPDDGSNISKISGSMAARPVRKSFAERAHFIGSKFRRPRTVWQPEDGA